MYTAKHQIEKGDPNEEIRARTVEAEDVFNLIGRTKISNNQTPPKLSTTKPPTEDYWGWGEAGGKGGSR